MNCKEVDDFKLITSQNLKKFIPGNVPVYVATNEIDSDIVSNLVGSGMLIFSNISSNAKFPSLFPNLTSVDIFMIELMLMCSSTYYMAWGWSSSIHRYVASCREMNNLTNSSYIFNDNLGFIREKIDYS